METQKIKILSIGIILILITVTFSGCIDDPADGKPSYNEIKAKLGLRSPTYDEMVEFIERDRTNDREYEKTFTCGDFSDMLIKNARNNGFDVGYVVIYQTKDEYFDSFTDIVFNPSHALVCFNTTDGIYFVEPQNDKIMSKHKFRWYQREDYYPYAGSFTGLSSMKFHHYRTDWFHDITYSWNYDRNEWLIDFK